MGRTRTKERPAEICVDASYASDPIAICIAGIMRRMVGCSVIVGLEPGAANRSGKLVAKRSSTSKKVWTATARSDIRSGKGNLPRSEASTNAVPDVGRFQRNVLQLGNVDRHNVVFPGCRGTVTDTIGIASASRLRLGVRLRAIMYTL